MISFLHQYQYPHLYLYQYLPTIGAGRHCEKVSEICLGKIRARGMAGARLNDYLKVCRRVASMLALPGPRHTL